MEAGHIETLMKLIEKVEQDLDHGIAVLTQALEKKEAEILEVRNRVAELEKRLSEGYSSGSSSEDPNDMNAGTIWSRKH